MIFLLFSICLVLLLDGTDPFELLQGQSLCSFFVVSFLPFAGCSSDDAQVSDFLDHLIDSIGQEPHIDS
jgi:hypothetical protein